MYNFSSITAATEAVLSDTIRKQEKKKKRRFSDEQITQLESIYESESRPELWMKQDLANKTGLHPRQVDVWFQNRRSRSKPKQIEQSYQRLKISYDTLASKFNSLKKENQRLLLELEGLRNQMENSPQGRGECQESRESNCEEEEKANLETGLTEELNYLNIDGINDDTLIQSGNWSSFDYTCLHDYSACGSHWWDSTL